MRQGHDPLHLEPWCGWSDPVDIGGIESSRELEAICIAWVKIGGTRGRWGRGFKLARRLGGRK